MKIADVKTKLNDFTYRVLFGNPIGEKEKEIYDKIKSHCRKAKDFDDFVKLILEDESLDNTQAYAEILTYTWNSDRWIRKKLLKNSINVFFTESDVGSIMVGNELFHTYIPNGCGDGLSECFIIKDNDFNHDMMKYYGTLKGQFNIYDYDCCNKRETNISYRMNGNYQVYYFEGMVAFVEY